MIPPPLLFTFVILAVVHHIDCMAYEEDRPILKCVPNKLFVYDHNICYCNNEGTEITCKRKMYTTLAPELHFNQLQNISIDCVPDKLFNYLCRDCICHESGKYASCLSSKCQEKTFSETPEKCIPGSVFKNHCNGCICGNDGKAVCTNINCNTIGGRGGIQCVPRTLFMVECNTCDCSDDGASMFCDKFGCIDMTFDHEHILNVTLSCEASSTFNYNCHQCFCDESGSYAMCSGKECPRWFDFKKVTDTVEKCNPGMIFANDCNVCICGKDSKGVCTTFNCNTSYRFKYVEKLDFVRPNP